MKIIPNYYNNLTKICLICGFPVTNSNHSQAKYCQLPRIEGKKTSERSPCQEEKERQNAQKARENRNRQDKKYEYELCKLPQFANTGKEAMRTCLRCPEGAPEFLSKSVHNRICPSCSNKEASVDVTHLSRVAGDIACPVLFMDTFSVTIKGE